MFTILIFSKDRPCQLDLLLRSAKMACPEADIQVLFTYSARPFEYGYFQLMTEHVEPRYFLQDPFKKRLLERLKDIKTPYVLPMCDDYVFIRPFDTDYLPEIFHLGGVKCVSLLLHQGITRSFAHVRPLDKPEFLKIGPYLIWDWSLMPPKSDWGYPHQAGGNIYRTEYFYKLLRFKKFQAPNSMESAMSWPVRKRKRSTPLMAAFPDQKVLATAINRTQNEVNGNRLGGNQYSLEVLNDRYLSGKRIVNNFKQSNMVMDDVQIKWR